MDTAAAWNGGVVPTNIDIAQWTTSVTGTGSGAGLAANATFGQLLMQNSTAVTIAAGGGNLTLAGISGVGIDMTGATQNLTLTAPVTLGGTQAWNLPNGRTLTINGGVGGGTNGVTFNGIGGVTFAASSSNSYTGTTTLNGTNLITIMNSTSTGINAGSPVAVSGAAVHFTSVANGGNITPTFNGVTVNPGWSTMDQNRMSNTKIFAVLGNITRGGVGGALGLSNSNQSSTVSTTTANTNGIIAGWVLYGPQTDFAKGAATAGASTAIAAPTYTNDTWAAANNTTVTLASNPTAYDNVTTNSLRFGVSASSTVNLSGTNTVTSGGVLVSSGVTTGFSNVITGGTLRGAAGADLVVHQCAAGTTSLAINSIIADNTSATALTKTGAGLLTLGGANTFSGGIYVNQGELKLTAGGSLNSNAVTFPNNSSGVLSLGGVNATAGALNTSSVLAATLPVVQNAGATAATLTLSPAAPAVFNGNLQDGTGGGSFGLAKSGTAMQTLNGTNTYTGPTSITNGTLFVKNSITSSSAISVTSPGVLDVTTSGLTVGSGNNLSGTGSVLGSVTAGAGAAITPGTAGTTGTLTVDTLALNSGAALNLDLQSGGVADQVHVTGALTLGAGQVINVNLAGTGVAATGTTYTILTYGSQANFTAGSFTIAAGGVGGLTYTFADTGTSITLTISGTLATNSTWTSTGGGSWGTGSNWSSTVPNGLGDTANFGNSITAGASIALDGFRTVGVLNLNSPNPYVFVQGTGGFLILDNGSSVASINDSSVPSVPSQPGQWIASNVYLTSNTQVTVTGGETLAISGAIDGLGSLAKLGAGTLDLQVANTYTGGTSLSAGTLNVVSGGLGTGAFSFVGGTLRYATGNTDDLSASRTVTFAGQAIVDTNGNDVTFASAVGNSGIGGLTKTGAGSLTLGAANTYTGANLVAAGTLKIAADLSLGQAPAAAVTNLTLNAGATLLTTAPMTLVANRKVVLAGGIGTIDTSSNAVTIAGNVGGSALFHKAGDGNLTLTGANSATATGGISIDGGTVFINDLTNLPGGTITLNGTSGISTGSAAINFNNVVANGTNLLNKGGTNNIMGLGAATGSGSLTLNNVYVTDLTGSLTGFNGTIIASGTGFRLNGTGGGTNLTLNLGNFGASIRSGGPSGGTITIGQLLGTGGVLSGGGGGYTGAGVYVIGGKTVEGAPQNSSFGGVIANGATPAVAVTKVGASSLTLSGINTYTGNTTVNEGSLVLVDNGGLTFKVGANGVTNAITGTSSGSVSLDGDFTLDLSGAAIAGGNSWTLVNRSALGPVTFGPNFTVVGFTESADVWTKVDGSNTWTFTESTGVLSLSIAGYSSWATTNGLTGATGFENAAGDDPDKDGVPNLLEYVLGGNPLASSLSVMPQLTVQPTTFVFTFTRNVDSKSDVVLTFQYGSALAGWTDVSVGTGNSGPDGNGVTVAVGAGSPENITVTVPRALAGSGKLFGRLKATK